MKKIPDSAKMQQQATVVFPGLRTTTKTVRSHPLRADDIAKRLNAGKFRRVEIAAGGKKTGTLRASFHAVLTKIKKQYAKFSSDANLRTFNYDMSGMIAGTYDDLVNFINDHKDNDKYDASYLNNTYFQFFNYLWLNDKMNDFASAEEVYARAQQDASTAFLDLNYFTQYLQYYKDFFAQQEGIKQASAELAKPKKKPKYDEVVAQLGVLVNHHISKAVSRYLKEGGVKATTGAKPSRRKEHSIAKYFIPTVPGNHILITRNKQGTSLSLSNKAPGTHNRYRQPFAAFPSTFVHDLDIARAIANDAKNNIALTEKFLEQQTVLPDLQIHPSDDANTRLRKANGFIQYLETQINTFMHNEGRQAAVTNLQYGIQQPVQQQFAFAPQQSTGAAMANTVFGGFQQ